MREAWQPADAMQEILVEDLASLYWRRIQAARAHAADPAACEELLKWIAEEKQDVAKERELFERRGQNPSAGGCARRGLEESLETGLRGARIGYIHCQLLGKMR